MKRSLAALAAFLSVGTLPPVPGAGIEGNTFSVSQAKNVSSTTKGQAPTTLGEMVKAALSGAGHSHRIRANRGKSYSASIRQHQRHAAKLRNKAAHRRANR